MRRLSLTLLAALAAAGLVARDLSRRRAVAELVRAYFRAWERGDAERLQSIVSDDYTGHVNALAGIEERDRDELSAALAAHAQTFTRSAFTVEDLITDRDRVAARVRLRATHGDDDRNVQTSGLVHLRIRDGRVVEEWASWDYLGLAGQLGVGITAEP